MTDQNSQIQEFNKILITEEISAAPKHWDSKRKDRPIGNNIEVRID